MYIFSEHLLKTKVPNLRTSNVMDMSNFMDAHQNIYYDNKKLLW